MAKNKYFKSALIIFACFFIIQNLSAQYANSYYFVSFKNKNNTTYSLNKPSEFLSERAITRRYYANIEIDSTDLPVDNSSIDSLINFGADIKYTSK